MSHYATCKEFTKLLAWLITVSIILAIATPGTAIARPCAACSVSAVAVTTAMDSGPRSRQQRVKERRQRPLLSRIFPRAGSR